MSSKSSQTRNPARQAAHSPEPAGVGGSNLLANSNLMTANGGGESSWNWPEIVNGLQAGSQFYALTRDYYAMTRNNQICGAIAERFLGLGTQQGALQQTTLQDLPPPERALVANA